MTIQTIIPKSEKSLKPTLWVSDFKNIYILQAAQDLLDTLKEKQRTLDIDFPNTGGGVGLASNQIEYPYEAVSNNDDTPKKGYYPKNFIPPNIYVVSIRKERAMIEKCEAVEPSVYINATFDPMINSNMSSYQEGCLSVSGFQGFSIPRYEHIRVRAYNENGKEISFSAHGFIARVHQHEIDHGLGKEYLNQLEFTDDELKVISSWINAHENKIIEDPSGWIVKDKLKCISKNPDYVALLTWVGYELSRTKETTSFLHGKHAYFGATAFAAAGQDNSTINITSDLRNSGGIPRP